MSKNTKKAPAKVVAKKDAAKPAKTAKPVGLGSVAKAKAKKAAPKPAAKKPVRKGK